MVGLQSQHFSSRAIVGIGSFLLTLIALQITRQTSGYPARTPVRLWPRLLITQLRRDINENNTLRYGWAITALCSISVSGLHFGGLYFDIYTAVSWWDILTHSLSGFGVAAVLGLTFQSSIRSTTYWVIPAVFAFGTGFEVYEFLFKTFWYNWTLRFYLLDTVIDLIVNTTGAIAFVVGVHILREVNILPDSADDNPMTAKLSSRRNR
ncbi:hypothetical protein [Haloquadratum walsbyi]|jgi:hypothetical protein|uniref:Uncharacterized protein n=1 Tax=Haloquadratum walsbyi J07HQW2 TaxID=1238425 RepID=U1PS79_9EURY|nr:hypothetical protein [Haloquadratum walsbyi]ERG96652.1 MAG: hypothetical protein J07HQW2_03135 [Haloquadratum walsbyi J07HQW2]